MNSLSKEGLVAAILSGLTLHLLFRNFEKTHLSLLITFALTVPILPSYILNSSSTSSPFWSILISYATCYTTLFGSILFYRLSNFHPLAKHPGPTLAKCTKFWGMYQSHTGKLHEKYLELHRQYGPVVRIGPNELSFCDVEAIQPILGTDGMGKGPTWEGRQSARKKKRGSLVGVRAVVEHLHRRKPWNKAFNTSGVKAYEPLLRARLLQLVEILDGKAGGKQVVDIAEWLSFFSYDFMGDMAFRAGFELMRDGDKNGLWKIMESGITVQSYAGQVTWLGPLFNRLPGLGSSAQKLREFVGRIVKDRVQNGTELEGEDLSTYLLDEKSSDPKPLPLDIYAAEAFLAVVAGSDTAATCMSCVFFYILNDKAIFDRLRAEMDSSFPPEHGVAPHEDTAKLATMPFLNAVINEALRLQPPVPTGLQRASEPGSGGKMVGSIFVSEETAVNIAPYAIHRDPRYFSPDPDRFWPDRWLAEKKENVELDQAAFIPFSVGPMNCVGKALAQVELRAVIATLVQCYDMNLEEGWDRTRWEEDLEDFFVFRKGALPVKLQRRI